MRVKYTHYFNMQMFFKFFFIFFLNGRKNEKKRFFNLNFATYCYPLVSKREVHGSKFLTRSRRFAIGALSLPLVSKRGVHGSKFLTPFSALKTQCHHPLVKKRGGSVP